jgi:ABC-type phosphate transport system ATPase subunit
MAAPPLSAQRLLDGEVVEAGPTGRISGQPADQRTADYVAGRFG